MTHHRRPKWRPARAASCSICGDGCVTTVARTAFYCCIIRADDAASRRPVCGDALAHRFLDDAIRRDLAAVLRQPRPAASNVARHRLIDDLVRDQLHRRRETRIILLGAGFDTRAFRLSGGRYFEIDDPQLLAYKESRLAAREAPNPLARIPVAFGSAAPAEFLAPLAGDDDALVILEGVSMYLGDDTLATLAAALVRALPRATLVCDLMSPRFAATYGKPLRDGLEQMGAQFGARLDHPSRPFIAAGYLPRHRYSVVDRSRQAGTTRIPSLILNTVLRELRDGYQVWVFDPPR